MLIDFKIGDIVWVDVFGEDVIGKILSINGNYLTFEYLDDLPRELQSETRNAAFVRRLASIDDMFQYAKQLLEDDDRK